MRFDNEESYHEGSKYKNKDKVGKIRTIGYTDEGHEIKAAFYYHISTREIENEDEKSVDKLDELSLAYYNYFVFQYIVRMLKDVKRNTPILQRLGMDLVPLIKEADDVSNKYMQEYIDLYKRDRRRFNVESDFFYYDEKTYLEVKIQDFSLLDKLHIIKNVKITPINEGECIFKIETCYGTYTYNVKFDIKEEFKKNLSQDELDSLYKEYCIVEGYHIFIFSNMLRYGYSLKDDISYNFTEMGLDFFEL